MGEYRQTFLVFTSTLALCALGLTWVAQAQTGPSPFAKKGQQAWESGTPTQSGSASTLSISLRLRQPCAHEYTLDNGNLSTQWYFAGAQSGFEAGDQFRTYIQL